MASDSGLQDSVDRTRDAFRRSVTEGHDAAMPLERPAPLADRPIVQADAGADRPNGHPDLHPFFKGLLDLLPEPGADWPRAKREQWLETARSIFALIYADPMEADAPLRLHVVANDSRGASEPDRYSA
jgi:hypothetical protein